MDFADVSASELYANCSLPQIEYSIPIINKFVQNGPFQQPQLFAIMGFAQSYKTSIAVELLTSFTLFEHLKCEAIWLDCNFKFPIDLLKSRKIDLNKIKVAQCECSEHIIYNLLLIEHELEKKENNDGAPLRAIIIDSINSSYWIDVATNNISNNSRYALKNIIERFVNRHGITMIVVFDDLFSSDPWKDIEQTPYIKLICSSKKPGKGNFIIEPRTEQDFTVLEDRSFHWGNNRDVSNDEKEENTENNN